MYETQIWGYKTMLSDQIMTTCLSSHNYSKYESIARVILSFGKLRKAYIHSFSFSINKTSSLYYSKASVILSLNGKSTHPPPRYWHTRVFSYGFIKNRETRRMQLKEIFVHIT